MHRMESISASLMTESSWDYDIQDFTACTETNQRFPTCIDYFVHSTTCRYIKIECVLLIYKLITLLFGAKVFYKTLLNVLLGIYC